MYFNNDRILQSDNDIIIGVVDCGDKKEITFLNYQNRLSQVFQYYISIYVSDLQSEKISYQEALSMVSEKIYNTLNGNYIRYCESVEELAEYLMQTQKYESWEAFIENRFRNIHEDKITLTTNIPAIIDDGISQQHIKQIIKDVNFETILQVLSMSEDIPSI